MAKKKPVRKTPVKKTVRKKAIKTRETKKPVRKVLQEKAQQENYTVLDIGNEIKRRYKPKARPSDSDKARLKEKQEQLKFQRLHNKKIEQQRRKLKYIAYEKKSVPKNQRANAIYQLKHPGKYGRVKFHESLVKNDINRLKGKPFFVTINDGFEKVKVRSDVLAKKKNPSLFVAQTFEKHVQNAIKKEKRKKKVSRKKVKVLNKLLAIAHKNVQNLKEPDARKREKKFKVKYDKKGNMIKPEGDYPILVDFFTDIIDIN